MVWGGGCLWEEDGMVRMVGGHSAFGGGSILTVEVNSSAVVGIDFIHDVLELGLGGLETQLAHDIAELLSCDFTYIRILLING